MSEASKPHSEPDEPRLSDYIDMEAYDVVPGDVHRRLVEQLETYEQALRDIMYLPDETQAYSYADACVNIARAALNPAIRQEWVAPGDASGGTRVSDSPGTPFASNQDTKPS